MDPLNLQHLSPPGAVNPVGDAARMGSPAGSAPGEANFGDMLKQALQDVNEAQAQSEGEARNLMTGQGADMHSAILAVQKADVSFQMMMAVRSKLIEAYREVMRMPM